VSTTHSPTEQDDRAAEAGAGPNREDATSRQGSAAMDRRSAPSTPPALGARAQTVAGSKDAAEWSAPSSGEPASDRAVDADLLLDIPRLSVEELNVELEAALILKRVKLDAKGLDAGLFLKSNLDNFAAVMASRSSDERDAGAAAKRRGGDAARVRSSLRERLGSTRDADRDVHDRDVQQPRELHESAGEGYARVAAGETDDDAEGGENAGGDGSSGLGGRAVHAAKQGAKALGLTAAGVAGGALLESRLEPSRRLALPRRRSRALALVHGIRRRLP
jgi:hypothetical protein